MSSVRPQSYFWVLIYQPRKDGQLSWMLACGKMVPTAGLEPRSEDLTRFAALRLNHSSTPPLNTALKFLDWNLLHTFGLGVEDVKLARSSFCLPVIFQICQEKTRIEKRTAHCPIARRKPEGEAWSELIESSDWLSYQSNESESVNQVKSFKINKQTYQSTKSSTNKSFK